MSAAVPPQGVVTFLFTDIEGSTRRWEADPDGMRRALDSHNALLHRMIEEHDGWLFKHTGDGVCAAFSSPSAAVDAAVAAQLELQLPVRMGIATGEAQLSGGDYFGPVLNRTSRVMVCGHGGQILIDAVTAGLASGVDLIPLGPRRLRDLTQPVELFQVQAPGLGSEFPSLRTLDPAPGNLRPQTTSLVGRESAIAEVKAVLSTHRLVTLTGVGGVGKTRLALEVAARVANGFSDGVWVIELAAVGDPAAVPEAVAAVLGIKQQPASSLANSVAAAMEGRSRLLVFDNCEHVLDAAADMIEAIFAHSTTVKILATSREGLRVGDEQLWTVPSLDVDSGIESTAATLFRDRAHAVAQGISLTRPDESAAVAEICRRLDGIPLAIELAASRMVSMTAVEVRDRLDDRFRLLVGSRRGLERHQTLHHAVQWSFDLLDDAERALLNRCSVFTGGFELAGACALTGSDNELATLDLLDALVRKSLLVADRSSGRTRFSMLETIRQFAEGQLADGGEADDARATHARYFAARESDVLELWDSPRQRDAYEWFTVELANLRTAFHWAADHGDLDTAAAIAFYSTFLGIEVEQHEPNGWTEELIAPARAVEHRRLAQLYSVASRCYDVGRIDDAVGYSDAGQAAVKSGRFDPVPYDAASQLGGAYLWAGHPERCIRWHRAVLAQSSGPHPYTQAGLVLALQVSRFVDEAQAACEGLLEAAEATGNPRNVCFTQLAFGIAYRDADPDTAYDVLCRALATAEDSGNRHVKSSTATTLALHMAIYGHPVDALDFVTLAIRNHYDYGSFTAMRNPLGILAAIFDRLGYYEPAATITEFAVSPMLRGGFPEIDSHIAHLRTVLGDGAYESFAGAGAQMSNAAMVAYAFEQIDLVRAEVAP